MKLISKLELSRKIRRARRRRKVTLRRKKGGKSSPYSGTSRMGTKPKVIHFRFPKSVSLTADYEGTMEIISQLKQEALTDSGGDRLFRMDFSRTEEVSLAAVLLLSSEIDRAISLSKVRGKNHFFGFNMKNWKKEVTAYLGDFGFLDLLKNSQILRWSSDALTDGFAVVKMIACGKYSKESVATITRELSVTAEFFDQSPYIYEGLVEAMGNVVDHAYPTGGDLEFEAIEGDWWWAAATYMHWEKEIRVVVYDQGVGIPNTLPQSGLWEHVLAQLAKLGHSASSLVQHDARMIDAAIGASRTSRDTSLGRGKGLAEIAGITAEIGGSTVRVLSGLGCVLYKEGEDPKMNTLSKHIGGTMIEWRVPITRASGEQV